MSKELLLLKHYLGNNVQVFNTDTNRMYNLVLQNYTRSIRGGITLSDLINEPKVYIACLRPLLELSNLVETEFINYRMGMQYDEEIINLFCLEFTHSDEKLIDIDLTTLPYQCAEYFFKYGYDFFDLIQKGLAININTLSVQNLDN